MHKIKTKPLSVNDAWQGKRYKTKSYKLYEKSVFYSLPNIKLPSPPYKIYLEFGFSSISSDWDNPVKIFQDILQKRYKFDDKNIYEGHVKKIIVKKGEEYIKFKIDSIISNVKKEGIL